MKSLTPTLIALACAAMTGHALAQTNSTLERVEVTGSHIKRASDESATPIQVLRREDLQRTGAATVADLLATLSSSSGSLSDLAGANSFAPGASSASLRNLGAQSTLVLLNFRRLSPYPLANFSEVFTNLNSLPAEAVERIEILRSGGSSIYGSDAVAGVINIITRQDYAGLQASASHERSSGKGQFANSRASLSAGYGKVSENGFNLFGNLELYKRDAEPSWRKLMSDVNPAYLEAFPQMGGAGTQSPFSHPGNLFPVDRPPLALPGCKTPSANGLCMRDTLAQAELTPATERANLLLRAKYRPAKDIDGYTELLYAKTRNDYAGGHFTTEWPAIPWVNPVTKEQLTFINRGLPAGHPLNPSPFEARLNYQFADDGALNRTDTHQYRFLTGLQGSWGQLDWDVAVGVMGGKSDMMLRGFASNSGWRELIGDYNAPVLAPDFFNKPNGYKLGQTNSPAVLSRLFPMLGWTGDNRQVFVDGKISGEVAQWQHGAVGLATGFDLRQDRMIITPSHNIATGDIVGLGTSSSNGKRKQGSLYAELSLPVLKDLTVEAAGRVDKFDGFGAHFTPKLAARYQPSRRLMLRGTLEGGFRAPNLTEAATATKSSYSSGIMDPKRCEAAQALFADLMGQAAALDPADPMRGALEGRAFQAQSLECAGWVNTVTLNNPKLKPETSRSWTVGLVFEPSRGWNLALDYYNIERKGEISAKSVQEMLATEAGLPAGTIQRETRPERDQTFHGPDEIAKYFGGRPYAGQIVTAANQFENQFKTRTSGVDFSLNAVTPSPLGRLSWTVDASYLINFQTWLARANQYGVNMAGRYGYSRMRLRNTLGLRAGDFSHGLSYALASGTSLQGNDDDSGYSAADCAAKGWNASQCQVGKSEQFDYHLAYSGFKNLTLSLNVRNLFNDRPPLDFRAADQARGGLYPFNAQDVMGRTFRISAEYRFF